MAAAGGAIGTAITPGVGTAIGTVLGSLLDGPMTGSSQQSGPAGPSSAAAAVYGSGLNADNWFVNFGGTQTPTGYADKSLSATGPTASTAATGGAALPGQPGTLGGMASSLGGMASNLGMDAVPLWAWAAIAGMVVWKLKSRK